MSARMPSRPDLGPKPHLGYTQSLIDRAAERRLDAAGLAAYAADPRARPMSSAANMIVLKKGGAAERSAVHA